MKHKPIVSLSVSSNDWVVNFFDKSRIVFDKEMQGLWSHVLVGEANQNLGQHEAAVDDCNEAIRLKPDYAEAYINRGAAKAALGQHDDAIADYGEAIRLRSGLAEAYYHRGVAKIALGLKDEAREDFETALEMARNAEGGQTYKPKRSNGFAISMPMATHEIFPLPGVRC